MLNEKIFNDIIKKVIEKERHHEADKGKEAAGESHKPVRSDAPVTQPSQEKINEIIKQIM
ncbi:MAG TPA: hypothetical protein VGN63_19525 [Flavisolibacter sp.]|jgi:hypothetical protein|nr:hypothetical protein [Flavisolibacter sp.]